MRPAQPQALAPQPRAWTDNDCSGPKWCIVVPIKRLDEAKSRIVGPNASRRAHLALAFAADTVTAVLRCAEVRVVIAVTNDPGVRAVVEGLGAEVVLERERAGLNAALDAGAALARRRWPWCGVGALLGDLPALRPTELSAALQFAEWAGRRGRPAVVADSEGRGTTAYLASTDIPFQPLFGPASLGRHVLAGAMQVRGLDMASLSQDVDTEDDLLAAIRLGVGKRTAAVLDTVSVGRAGG